VLPPWNAVRFAPDKTPAHVESYFFKLNDGHARRALWLKATIFARPGQAPIAEAWAISFDRDDGHRAAKQTVPRSAATFPTGEKLGIRVASLSIDEGRLHGSVASGGVSIAFDLAYTCDAPPMVPFHTPALYETKLPRLKYVSPVPDARFTGTIDVDGRHIEVDGWRGMYGHNWSNAHGYRYSWVQAVGFEGHPDVVFEGGTGRIALGPVISPPITLACLRVGGVRYDFNRPLDILRARATMSTRVWTFHTKSDLGSLEGEVVATPDDVVGLLYENPVGDPCFCLNTKLARANLRFTPRGRTPIDLVTGEAALEVGTTDPTHGTRIHV
jgi:hypothetical protein